MELALVAVGLPCDALDKERVLFPAQASALAEFSSCHNTVKLTRSSWSRSSAAGRARSSASGRAGGAGGSSSSKLNQVEVVEVNLSRPGILSRTEVLS